ncbi:MAG TPA: hypothetical protein VD866_01385 [Urbifossiella sp.]|nr:hypothetical protein [Urbifossiella sp.]
MTATNPGTTPIGGAVADSDLEQSIRTAVAARVPRAAFARYQPVDRTPRLGDVVLAEVESVGDDDRVETAVIPWQGAWRGDVVPYVQATPSFATLALRPGRRVIGVIGGRYATDYMLAEVPAEPTPTLDLLTFGGVIGRIVSRNSRHGRQPTVRPIAYFSDRDGRPVNTRQYCPPILPGPGRNPRTRLILVTGGSMESGKTTAVQAIVQLLTRAGREVFAGKVTGCGSFRDPHRIGAGGAEGVTEFMAFGFPSTHGVEGDELRGLFWGMVRLLTDAPSARTLDTRYIVLEIADGLGQPETRALLTDPDITSSVHRVVYAALDPVSAAGGVGILRRWGWASPIVTGPVANSDLSRQEVCWLCENSAVHFLNTAPSEPWGQTDLQLF